MEIKEFNISVPWGHIAVKAWGDESNEHILCFHGVLDNAASFDVLIPLLPKSFYYVVIDLPGHGKSSHFPPFLPLHLENFLIVPKLIMDYFNKETYIVIAHSFGAQVCLITSQLFPEKFKKLICLDALGLFLVTPTMFKNFVREFYEDFVKLDNKLKSKKSPKYTYERAVQKVQFERRYGELNRKTAEAITNRNVRRTEDGMVEFITDQRMKNVLIFLHDISYLFHVMKKHPFQKPTLLIGASESNELRILFARFIKNFQKFPCITLKNVEGTHDVHNTHPERVAPIITKFLIENKNKL